MLLKKWKVGQFGLSLAAVHWIGVPPPLALTGGAGGVAMTTVLLSRTATTIYIMAMATAKCATITGRPRVTNSAAEQ